MNADLPALIAALARPEAYPHPAEAIEVHQTHISVVFLAGAFAYKIKKPVNLGFVDYSTLEKRQHFCEEEVRLNRRLAPDVYLGVVPIVANGGAMAAADAAAARRASEGRLLPALAFRATGSGDCAVVEWAVQMKRLPAEATLESRLKCGQVTAGQIRALAERVADFHRRAEANPRIAAFGRFEVVAGNARENLRQAESLVGKTVSPDVFERVRQLTEGHLGEQRGLIESRAGRGVPRDTHGDLRLDHVYLFPEAAAPGDLAIVDCIEFSDRFRYADPVADMAFLAMDLSYHGRRDLANIFADAYFAAADDAEGRALVPFYSAYRAVVRAKVEGMELGETEIDAAQRQKSGERAKAHWLLALGELAAPGERPCVVLLGGLPGTGKSTLGRFLAESAGFTQLRSDLVRKEIARSGGIYSPERTERTYAELLSRGEELLWHGGRVLIDANFRADWQRQLFFDAARRWAVPILFVHCQADRAVIRARLQQRRGDASDADWSIFEQLAQTWEPVAPALQPITRTLDTSGPIEQNKANLLALLEQVELA